VSSGWSGRVSQRRLDRLYDERHVARDHAGLVSRLEQADQRITLLLAAGSLQRSGTLSEKALSTAAKRATIQGDFDPHNLEEAVVKATRAVTQRRGQPQFREALLAAYGSRCAITGCDAKEALEAAHILPYRGEETNHVQNGLLLRADIHTLFDLGLIAIDTDQSVVVVHPTLRTGHYSALHGSELRRPQDPRFHPSREALDTARRQAGL
jgi:predicted restriction endonuclease